MDTHYPAPINPNPQDPAPPRWQTDKHPPCNSSKLTSVYPSVCFLHSMWSFSVSGSQKQQALKVALCMPCWTIQAFETNRFSGFIG